MNIRELEPRTVWNFFADLCEIPRPSGHEENVARYIEDFADERGFEHFRDERGNVIVRKNGTGSLVALQAHMDMVCEKNGDVEHDFLRDPIKTLTDGSTVTADGTTLGADDGIGVALILAVLAESDRSLECLFTVEEETSLGGATDLKPGILKAGRMINIDSGCEREMLVGCAGGSTLKIRFPKACEYLSSDLFALRIKVGGLVGGHSGEDIDKNRANAVKLLGNFLAELSKKAGLRLCSISGGGLSNAIAREAEAVIAFSPSVKELVRVEANVYAARMEEIYKAAEPQLKFSAESCPLPERCYSDGLGAGLLRFLAECPHGVMETGSVLPGLVDGSCNLASVRDAGDGFITVVNSQRHSDTDKLRQLSERIEKLATLCGAETENLGSYPGWKPDFDNELVKKAVAAYEAALGFAPKVTAVHAGLECGCFKSKYPELEMISIGPDMSGIHSPDETLSVRSVGNIWKCLRHLLATL